MMRMYHRTSAANATNILREGFKNATGTYFTDREFSGVWLSLEPFDVSDGAPPSADTLLLVEIDLAAEALADYEWVEEGKVRREWLVPAELINSRGRASLAPE